MNKCGCEYGYDCTKTTVCAVESAVEAATEELRGEINELVGTLSNQECDTHFWKSRAENLQAKVKELEARLEATIERVKAIVEEGTDDYAYDSQDICLKILEALAGEAK